MKKTDSTQGRKDAKTQRGFQISYRSLFFVVAPLRLCAFALKFARNDGVNLMNRFIMLISSGVLFSAALACAGDPAAQLGWQMAIHERTFQNFTVFECMDKTVALGLKCMSFSAGIRLEGTNSVSLLNLTDEQIQTIKKRAEANGLMLVNAYVPLPANQAQCRMSFEFARKMGLDTLVGEPEAAALDTVEKLCKEYNIRVAIHDHPKPSLYWDPQLVLEAIKGRSPLLGACADTGHWIRSGLDPVACLKTLQGHIFCLHFKDLNARSRTTHDVPWGTGVGQCKAMMEELKGQGFHGAFCVEYEYNWNNSMPEVAQCVKFFNETCAELVEGSPKP
jgi:sugar phosphate isomerase/epimerase